MIKTPVKVSAKAHDALTKQIRRWSDWDRARLMFGEPETSPFAHTDMIERAFVVNVDELLLNPNRVLLTVNPFRLRQEAVLTGVMLHEAGHARHSHWLPASAEAAAANPALHSDGTAPSKATVELAMLMEEARIEGLMSRDAQDVGASGLDWTMRAACAYLLPTTTLTVSDPDRALMELISSWAKRAGRMIAVNHWAKEAVNARGRMNEAHPTMPDWVGDFTALLTGAVGDHLMSIEPEAEPVNIDGQQISDRGTSVTMKTQIVLQTLRNMTTCTDDTGSAMLDLARQVLEILFPETPPDDMPCVGGGCGSMPQPQPEGDESEPQEGEEAEGGTDPQSGDQNAGEGSGAGQGEASEDDAEGSGSGEGSEADGEGEGEGEGESSAEPTAAEKAMSEALAALEKTAQTQARAEAKVKQVETPAEADPTVRGAGGGTSGIDGGWRRPMPEERATAANAGRFLRDLIDPTETTKRTLVDSPSAIVDGAALAAWRAGGQTRDPRFFVRTRREVMPAPPVKIAILVDVSESMGVLQKPSALLSWALANAAIDLRNFAGRGTQVESTLIHWGNVARVIQPNGGQLPGLREVVCREGTQAMDHALALVEEQMPGFFTPSETPENRLLVQFTDWDLFGRDRVIEPLGRMLNAGVNMLTIGPSGYHFRSDLPHILGRIPRFDGAGRSHEVVYNKMFPEAVWDEAAKVLGS